MIVERENNRLVLVEIESKATVVEYKHPQCIEIVEGSEDLNTIVIYD